MQDPRVETARMNARTCRVPRAHGSAQATRGASLVVRARSTISLCLAGPEEAWVGKPTRAREPPPSGCVDGPTRALPHRRAAPILAFRAPQCAAESQTRVGLTEFHRGDRPYAGSRERLDSPTAAGRPFDGSACAEPASTERPVMPRMVNTACALCVRAAVSLCLDASDGLVSLRDTSADRRYVERGLSSRGGS